MSAAFHRCVFSASRVSFSDKSKISVYSQSYRDSYDPYSLENSDQGIILEKIVTEIKNDFDGLIVVFKKTKTRIQASKVALWQRDRDSRRVDGTYY